MQTVHGVTLYRQVREEIEGRIKTRLWKPGDQIPNEETLARQCRVSRGTVRQAVQQLCAEGLLVRHQGRGTFVAEPRTVPFSVPEMFYRLTMDEDSPRFRVLSHGEASPPAWVVEQLHLVSDTPIFTLHRLRLAGDRAASIKTLYLMPQASMERMDEAALELPVIEMITKRLGLTVGSVDVSLELITLNVAEAETLGEESGDPGLRVVNRYMTPDAAPVIVSETVLPARLCRYKFTVPVNQRS